MKKKIFSVFLTTVLSFGLSVSSFAQFTQIITNNKVERVQITQQVKSDLDVVNSTSGNTESDNPRAVVTVLSGASTSQNSRAPQANFRQERCYYFISAAEMTASGFTAGNITSLGFNYSVGAAASGTFKVWFENAAAFFDKGTNFNAAIAPMTLTHTGVITLPAAAGTVDFTLSTPAAFTYTAGNGLWVAWEYSNPGGVLPGVFNTALCNTALAAPILRNSQSNDSLRVIQLSSSGFRPETRLGNASNDVITVGPIYSLGKAAICPCPDTNLLRVNMFHLRAQTDTVIVTTSVKNAIGGGTKFQFIDTIITSAVERFVIFYFYEKDGDTKKLDSIISVGRTLASEDITGNNRATYTKLSTLNKWNHATPDGLIDGGVGFTGATGDFVAGFYTSCTIPLVAVDLAFFAATGGGSQPYLVKIFAGDDDTLKPGALLYTSAPQVSPPGAVTPQRVTHKLSSPVTVGPGYYYVGLAQTGTVNLAFAFQNESPVRFSDFFFASLGVGNWTDFAAAGANFRLDIAPVTYLPLQVNAWLEGFYNGTTMVPDTVKVIAHSLTTLAAIDTAKSVMSSSGTGTFNFTMLNNDSCYIYQVRHRNHIQTWSHLACEKIDECGKQYDFRSSISQAFGNNMVFVPTVAEAGFAFYTGDVNQDDIVDGADCASVDNDASNFVTGYVATDLDGNGIVDGSDAAYCDNNAFNFVAAVIP